MRDIARGAAFPLRSTTMHLSPLPLPFGLTFIGHPASRHLLFPLIMINIVQTQRKDKSDSVNVQDQLRVKLTTSECRRPLAEMVMCQ